MQVEWETVAGRMPVDEGRDPRIGWGFDLIS